jgi:hypothetical protein
MAFHPETRHPRAVTPGGTRATLRPGVCLGGARIRVPSVGKPGHTPGNVKLLLPPRQSRGNSQCIRPIPGYVCMRLNLSREQMLARPFNVPVFAEPSSTSGKVGQASATVITKSPLHVQNGFAEILFLDGRIAWIPVNLLGPYATPANPNAHCTPSIMSDGKPGFG